MISVLFPVTHGENAVMHPLKGSQEKLVHFLLWRFSLIADFETQQPCESTKP